MIHRILLAAFLTVLIETTFLFAVGFRGRLFVICCILINFATNVILNFSLILLPLQMGRMMIIPFEIAVIFVEWGVLRFFARRKQKLFACVFAANLLSFSVGFLIKL